MSPEQINGGEPDSRSDIYSLGITFYEMVTGRRPFQGDSYSVLSAHLHQMPPAPIKINPALPIMLNDIILRAIAKDPAARFQTAEAFRAELDSAVTAGSWPANRTYPGLTCGTPAASPTAGACAIKPASRRRLYMAVGSAAAVALLVVTWIEGARFLSGTGSGAAARQDRPFSNGAPALPTPPQTSPLPGGGGSGEPPKEPKAGPPIKSGKVRFQAVVPKDLSDRLADVRARVAASDTKLELLSSQQKSHGLTPGPALSTALAKAHVGLQRTDANLAEGRYEDAQRSLDITEAALRVFEEVYGQQ